MATRTTPTAILPWSAQKPSQCPTRVAPVRVVNTANPRQCRRRRAFLHVHPLTGKAAPAAFPVTRVANGRSTT